MSSRTITQLLLPENLPDILRSLPRPNFAALLACSVAAFVWFELSPIWLPIISWLIAFLAPIFWLLCAVVVALAVVVLCAFGLALLGLLLGGTIPGSR